MDSQNSTTSTQMEIEDSALDLSQRIDIIEQEYKNLIHNVDQNIQDLKAFYDLTQIYAIKQDIKRGMGKIVKAIIANFDDDVSEGLLRSTTQMRHSKDLMKLHVDEHKFQESPENYGKNSKKRQDTDIMFDEYFKRENRSKEPCCQKQCYLLIDTKTAREIFDKFESFTREKQD